MQELLEPPTRAEQMAFNRKRWAEIVADPALASLPGKVESNAYGNVIMTPPASGDHSRKQLAIQLALMKRLGGFALPECPVSTLDGVRAAGVGWYSKERFAAVEGQVAFETCPMRRPSPKQTLSPVIVKTRNPSGAIAMMAVSR